MRDIKNFFFTVFFILLIFDFSLFSDEYTKLKDNTADQRPPSIEITGVLNNGKYGKGGVKPKVTVKDEKLKSYTILLSKAGSSDLLIESGYQINQEGNYTLKVTAVDQSGNESNAILHFSIDFTPPQKVKNIRYLVFGNKILLNWNKNNDPDLAGYNIYQNGNKVNTGVMTDNKMILTPGQAIYVYAITAVDQTNNESEGSAVTIALDQTLNITTPSSNDFINFITINGLIRYNSIKKVELSYAPYFDNSIIPDEWTTYPKTARNIDGKFIIPFQSRMMRDDSYIFRISALPTDGIVRQECIRVKIDHHHPITRLYVQELNKYYDLDSFNGQVELISLDTNATIRLAALDQVNNNTASGVKEICYKLLNESDLANQSFADYFESLNNWDIYKKPLILKNSGTYILAYYSHDRTLHFANTETVKIVKLSINKALTERKSGNIDPFNKRFAGITLIKPPEQDMEGACNVKYPLYIPPGVNDLQPELALSYNSSLKEDIYGYGWDFRLLHIYKTGNQNNYYIIDDQQQIPLNPTNVKGRYQIGEYTRYLQAVQFDTYWEITDKSGYKYILGMIDTSWTRDENGNEYWLINKVVDKNGNFIDYNYEKEYNNIKIKTILYGGGFYTIPYFEINFTYYAWQISIDILFRNENIKRYELNLENNTLTQHRILKDINEYGNDGYNFVSPFTTVLYYTDQDRLNRIENPLKGKIRIYYHDFDWKMAGIVLENYEETISQNLYDYSDQEKGFIIVRNQENNGNYSLCYYYNDNLRKGKLARILIYRNNEISTRQEYKWEIISGRLCLTEENITGYNHSEISNRISYTYNQSGNITRIDSQFSPNSGEDNVSYFMEYTDEDVDGNIANKLIYSYKEINNNKKKIDERYYYYDDLELGRVTLGNLTKEIRVDQSGIKHETNYEYNSYGKIQSVMNESTQMIIDYDKINNNYPASFYKISNEIILTTYDNKNGYLVSKEDDNRNQINYEYDNKGRLKNIRNYENTLNISLDYILGGDFPEVLITYTVMDKTYETSLVYDCFGRITRIDYPDGNSIVYQYQNGVLSAVSNENKNYIYLKSIEYDAFKRRIVAVYGDNRIYPYDISQKQKILAEINDPAAKAATNTNLNQLLKPYSDCFDFFNPDENNQLIFDGFFSDFQDNDQPVVH